MNEFPPVAFYFQLNFGNAIGKEEALFKEISGLTMEMAGKEVTEGSQNNFWHNLPTATKFSNLVLKKGLASKDSKIVIWCMNTFNGNPENSIKPKNIVVNLLDTDRTPLKSWKFSNAYPVKWVVSDLNSDNETVVIESLEFAYSYFK